MTEETKSQIKPAISSAITIVISILAIAFPKYQDATITGAVASFLTSIFFLSDRNQENERHIISTI
jgi:hypothetical protein